MKIDNILKDVFEDDFEVLKEIQAGLRCKTFIIKKNDKKYIFQLYLENTKYQARKKYNILKLFDINEIPKAYKVYECNNYSYLVSEFKDGNNLIEFSNSEVIDELAKVLVKIHNIKYNKFGWITDKTVLENDKFIDYINLEYERLKVNLDLINNKLKEKILNKVIQAMQKIEIESKDINESCLCWYDINPDNILINNNKLNAILDPGGARYGIPEWDLAFLKMEVCENQKQFEKLLESYKKYSNYKINVNLLNALTAIVELDDMAIRIIDHIELRIPYSSNFREEINLL